MTVTANQANADNAGGETGGGLFRSAGDFTIRNTIVVGNLAAATSNEVSGTINTASSLTSGTAAQILNTTLAPNGGATWTHAVVAAGPADDGGINGDAVDINDSALLSDQRGRTRFFGTAVDIGAFESSPAPGFTVLQTDGSTTVSESGTMDLLQISLTTPPASSVTLNIVSGDTSEVTVSFTSLIFSPGNWNVPQTVALTGVDDSVGDGNQTTVVTVAVNDSTSDSLFTVLPDQTVSVTTTDDETDQLPGDVDGDRDFDANDSFLIHLVRLSGTDQQIDQSKGSSPLSAVQIRAIVNGLGAAADVDGDNDFDANDSFLIHLIKLSGTATQIDQSKGSSPLSAAGIRDNVNALDVGAGANSFAAESPPVVRSVLAIEPDRDPFADIGLDVEYVPTVSGEVDRTDSPADSVWEEFRQWIDAI